MGWVLDPLTGVLRRQRQGRLVTQKRSMETDTQEESHVTEAEMGWCVYRPGSTKACRPPAEAGQGPGTDPASETPEGTGSVTLDLRLPASRTVRE